MSVITQKQGQLEYLTAEGISVPHCFTTRLGGVSTGIFDSLNIAIKEGETEDNVRENLSRLSSALGFSTDDLVLTRQTHSDIVRAVDASHRRGCFHRDYPECDALITATPGLALTVFTADCTPILLHDPVTGAGGAVHAGWKGTAQDIAGKTVAAMVTHYGCRPEDIRTAIGPNIGQCCFETDFDVPAALMEVYGREACLPHIRRAGEKYYVNLIEINALSLRRAGVRHIDISDSCTKCRPDLFWSHRYTRGQRGRQGAIIVCKEGCK